MKHSKEFRILDIYQRLIDGKAVNKQQEAMRHHVSERSIQRDIDSIRCFLSELNVMYGNKSRDVIYCKENSSYVIKEDCEHINGNIRIVIYMLTVFSYLILFPLIHSKKITYVPVLYPLTAHIAVTGIA